MGNPVMQNIIKITTQNEKHFYREIQVMQFG